MTRPDPAALQELLDRQAILDSIHRYCRGVDRLDRALLRSAYHAGAVDDHGPFSGPADQFIDWVLDFHETRHRITQHMILNHMVDIDGDTAHAETYFLFVGVRMQAPAGADFPPIDVAGGRYVDRLERRDGVWAIVCRRCIVEWMGDEYSPQRRAWLLANCAARRDTTDPSYDRPLVVEPKPK